MFPCHDLCCHSLRLFSHSIESIGLICAPFEAAGSSSIRPVGLCVGAKNGMLGILLVFPLHCISPYDGQAAVRYQYRPRFHLRS